jgi:UDP-3-O-[3-hydroxymyristoyl] glucosamine N-acyltransferase
MSSLTLGDVARRLGCDLVGDPSISITGVSTLEKAGAAEISFLANMKYAPKAKSTRAAAVLASEPLRNTSAATLVSANPYHDFARTLAFFYQAPRPAPGIHSTAVIDATSTMGSNPSIGAYVVVGPRTTIGDNAILHPHAVIYEGCIIGDDFTAHSHVSVREYCRIGHRVTLHNGVVIGGDGFGFAKTNSGEQFKIPQSGITVIEDDVEIQTLTSVDRATMGETRVRRGAKIDSLVQIGHACTVGARNIICAQAGLAGSTVLENDVTMAGQSGSAGHITIHQGATVYAQAGVGHDVPAGTTVGGSPAFEMHEWIRAATGFKKLPVMLSQLREIERRLEALEAHEPRAVAPDKRRNAAE